jgi:ZIP family zinc transporter
MTAVAYTLVPTLAVILGSLVALVRRPGASFVSTMQHLAAGLIFAATAIEILPQVTHLADPVATLYGGALGVGSMLALKSLESRFSGPLVFVAAIGIDILIDGLVLGLAFIAGSKAGILLTIALTLEVLFIGLTLTAKLGAAMASRLRVMATVVALALLLPLGAALAVPVATLSPFYTAGFLTFGVMALLFLVTEELLVEAHERPDTAFISAMFFVGFLALLTIEEILL